MRSPTAPSGAKPPGTTAEASTLVTSDSWLTAPETARSELEELRAEVKRLRQAERTLRREHAAEQRELKDANATYANHIQLLTLANTELRTENHQLQQQAARHTNLRVLDHNPARGPSR
jgi:hypothetical protein